MSDPDLPLNALRAFAVAGRHLNFRAAADELGVTQGAVAQQVRALEARIGIRLFERRPRGVRFTDAGLDLHTEISRAFSTLQTAMSRVQSAPSRVTISAAPSFAAKWLVPNLGQLHARHPQLEINVVATAELLSFFSDGIDIAIRQGQPPFGGSVSAHLLFPNRVIAVCSPALLAAKRLPLSAGEFARLPLLHDRHALWPTFLKQVAGTAVAAGARHRYFNQMSLSIDAALSGQGVALASRCLVAPELAQGRLQQVFDGSLDHASAFHVLTARDTAPRDAVAAVLEWLLSSRSV